MPLRPFRPCWPWSPPAPRSAEPCLPRPGALAALLFAVTPLLAQTSTGYGPSAAGSTPPPASSGGTPVPPNVADVVDTQESKGAGENKPRLTPQGVPPPADDERDARNGRVPRRRPTSPQTPGAPPRPAPGSETPVDDFGRGSPRTWELWWDLHRDRFVRTRPCDITASIERVRAEPRTRVLSTFSRIGAYERIGPALRLLLRPTEPDRVVANALIALAKIGEDPATPGSRTTYATLLPYLEARDDRGGARVRDAAIVALGVLGNEEALFPLERIAKAARGAPGEVGLRQRALAIYSMGVIARDSRREDVRRFVASRLCALYTAEPTLNAELKSAVFHALSLAPIRAEPDEFVARAEARGPTRRDAKRASEVPAGSLRAQIDWVLARLDDPEESAWIRAQAATAAGRLCASLDDASAMRERVLRRLMSQIDPRSNADADVRQSALMALGEVVDADGDAIDARARAALARAVTDSAALTDRQFAVLALAQAGARGGDSIEGDRFVAAPDVRRFLLHRLDAARGEERPWSALALGVFEHELARAGEATSHEARMALTDRLERTRSVEHSAAFSLAIGLAGANEATRELRQRITSGELQARGYAALALGMLGVREAAGDIEALLAEARGDARAFRPAAEALALLRAPVSRQLLAQLGGDASLDAQMTVCAQLGRVGDATSLRALSQLAWDEEGLAWVRASAAAALGNLGSRRGGPWNSDLGHGTSLLCLPATLSSPALDGILDLD